MKDYRLQVRIRNNRILRRIEEAGYVSVAEFCRAFGLNYTAIVDLARMTKPARGLKGQWAASAKALADALSVNPEDLFNERQAAGLAITSTEREIDEPPMLEACSMEAPSLEASVEQKELVKLALDAMPPRERRIIVDKFGLDGDAPRDRKDIADDLGVSDNRIMQLENKAIRRARTRLKRLHGVDALE